MYFCSSATLEVSSYFVSLFRYLRVSSYLLSLFRYLRVSSYLVSSFCYFRVSSYLLSSFCYLRVSSYLVSSFCYFGGVRLATFLLSIQPIPSSPQPPCIHKTAMPVSQASPSSFSMRLTPRGNPTGTSCGTAARGPAVPHGCRASRSVRAP